MIEADLHVHACMSVRIGNSVFIALGCIFLDNKKMVLGQGLEGTAIEDYVRIGGGTKILPGTTIGNTRYLAPAA